MTWTVFASTFPLVFLASLPGRTTFVMLMLGARQRPLGIFLGAALAFLCQTIISVLLGRVLAHLPQPWFQRGVGLLFLYFSFRFWREGSRPEGKEQIIGQRNRPHLYEVIRSAFILIFAAEWGDVSQVAIASLSARNSERLTVFCSSLLALWLIAALAVFIGSHIHRVIRPVLVQKLASIVFAGTGLYLLIKSLAAR